ncbi:MAG: succinate dehydrogenase, cytochrome b556 subunit [Gammaproteobacteria bacterium]|nr:succinate dehydrogenase, cytochrome b556 subunit [Gammaproteobacteria bacterium]
MSDTYPKRPVYLNLLRIRLPVGGVVSILHRITGVLLVLLIPVFLFVLQYSLANNEAYVRVAASIGSTGGRVAALILLIMLAHHLLAGVRHLLFDVDIGIGRIAARRSAWLVLVVMAILAIVSGGCLLL